MLLPAVVRARAVVRDALAGRSRGVTRQLHGRPLRSRARTGVLELRILPARSCRDRPWDVLAGSVAPLSLGLVQSLVGALVDRIDVAGCREVADAD
jgi:hypothetical protein